MPRDGVNVKHVEDDNGREEERRSNERDDSIKVCKKNKQTHGFT